MAPSTQHEYYFQTETSLTETERKRVKSSNNAGNPIKRPTKILAVVNDPDDDSAVFIAESGGMVARILLGDNDDKPATFRGPTAPITSLTLSPCGSTIYGGCWDTTIWSWDRRSRKPGHRFKGHADFVKCVVSCKLHGLPVAPQRGEDVAQGVEDDEILISGSQDTSIIIWRALTGVKLHVLKGHIRGILDLAIDPTSYLTASASDVTEDASSKAVTLYSAASDREIRRWRITASAASAFPITHNGQSRPENDSSIVLAHETSVNCLFTYAPSSIDVDDDQALDLEIWTASSDHTAKHICLPASLQREGIVGGGKSRRAFEVDTILKHPDYVRSVVYDSDSNLVVTACRDEQVRVWDASTGVMLHCFDGHFEEVTGLVVGRVTNHEGVPIRRVVVSVSLDATIRCWPLDRGEIKLLASEKAETADDLLYVDTQNKSKKKDNASMMTEEEERELAELMEEEDEDEDT